MHIKWLDDFVSLAKTRSFTRAAEERQVTLPAFGRRIKSLESWVGVPLVNRGTYPATLTEEGKLFLQTALEVLGRLNEGRASLRARALSGEESLNIATGRTLAHTLIPEVLDQVRRRVGTIHVRISTGSVHDMALLLEEGSADVLISYFHPAIGLNLSESGFEFLAAAREILIPVCKPDAAGRPLFPLTHTGCQPLPLLSYHPNLMMGNVLEWHLSRAANRYHFSRVFMADFAEALFEHVLQGVGVAWLPKRLVVDALRDKRLVPAGGAVDEIPLEVRCYRNRRQAKRPLDQLWQCLAENAVPPLQLI